MEATRTGLMLAMGLLAAAGAQRAAAQAAGGNLFQNPGFESNQDWWGFDFSFGTATGTLAFDDTLAVRSGAKGAKLTVTAVDGTNWHIQLQCPPQFEAVKDAEYRISFWGRTNAAEGKSVHLAIQDGAPNYAYRTGQDFRLDTAWQQFETTWTSDVAGLEALRFNIYVGSDTGTYYFDDFSLTAAADPSGVRHPKRAGGMPRAGATPDRVVDAAGRSLHPARPRGRAGITFSP